MWLKTFLIFQIEISLLYCQYTWKKLSISLQNNIPNMDCKNRYILTTSPDVAINFNPQQFSFVTFDAYFFGDWTNNFLSFGNQQYQPIDFSFTNYPCSGMSYDLKTLNYFNSGSSSNDIQIQNPNLSQIQVSLDFIDIFAEAYECHPSCKSCDGKTQFSCLSCFYGNPSEKICPRCPVELPGKYLSPSGCIQYCDINHIIKDGVCNYIQKTQLRFNYYYQASSKIYYFTVSVNPADIKCDFYANLRIKFQRSQIIISQKINIYLNQTYYGSFTKVSDQEYYSKVIPLIPTEQYIFADVKFQNPQYQIFITIELTIENPEFQISLYEVYQECALDCLTQKLPYECFDCPLNYYLHNDGNCYQDFFVPFAKDDGGQCANFDALTPYSSYIVEDFVKDQFPVDFQLQYTIISQHEGNNFLKGENIYYSKLAEQYVFGGPLVWSQAAFQSQYSNLGPHHRITIGFYIIFGPSFPSESSFVYTIEQQQPKIKKFIDANLECLGQSCLTICEIFQHNTDTLTIQYECFGSNKPKHQYCAFYNLHIAVHYCEPYCLQCSDENTCTQWSVNKPAYVQYSRQCLSSQFYDRSSYLCLDCPQLCIICQPQRIISSKAYCLTCDSTATLTQYYECKCKINQYIDNNQCLDCPTLCSQCLSSNLCTNCISQNYRQINNGQCECFQGYYEVISDPICKACHFLCQTCSGPSQNECLTCDSNKGLLLQGSECKCDSNTFYSLKTLQCQLCHSNCLTCFGETNQQCLSCNSSVNLVLKGFQCVCQQGYYEVNGYCTICPNDQDGSLSQCFNLCKNNSIVWYSIGCSDCDSGFTLVNNECIPICGDSLIVGYEQCKDDNNIMFDGCYQCQFQCPVQCLTCNSNTILPCQDICGDGYLTGTEECDDGNDIQYDGCYQCKFQCQEECTQCNRGICQQCQTLGFELINQKCYPCQKCTLGYQLDYQRNYCSQQIQSNCLIDSGKVTWINDYFGCQVCKDGYELIDDYCEPICGDNIVTDDEECDDGNFVFQDGCHMCFKNCGFGCQFCIGDQCQVCEENYLLINEICINENYSQIENQTSLDENLDNLQFQVIFGNIDQSNQNPFYEQNIFSFHLIVIDSNNLINFCEQINERNLCQEFNLSKLNIFDQFQELMNFYLLIKNLDHTLQYEKEIYSSQNLQYTTDQLVLADGQFGYKINQQQIVFKIYEECLQLGYLHCQITYDLGCSIFFQTYSSGETICQTELQINKIDQKQILAQTDFQNLNYQSYQEDCIKCQNIYPSIQYIIENYNHIDYLIIFQNSYLENFNQVIQIFEHRNTLNLLSIYQKATEICGDGFVSKNEECDDQNDTRFDGCYNCKYECIPNCESCIKGECIQCQAKYFLQNGICEQTYFIHCLEISNNKCLTCTFGYNFSEELNMCISIGGKNQGVTHQQIEIKKLQENKQLYAIIDSIICHQSCEECTLDKKCKKCKNGFEIAENQEECKSICGDEITTYPEVCDDGNSQMFDGCYQCQFQCIENCLVCNQGVCKECKTNYIYDEIQKYCILIFHTQGETIEGDEEQFGSFNQIQTFEFQAGCNERFTICFFRECFQCYLGYYGNNCIQYCGDGITAGNEQCDDKNEIEHDGCYNCRYSCPQHCLKCHQGQCIICKQQFYLFQNFCYYESQIENYTAQTNICGNQIVEDNEFCDDGNNLMFDGCFNCQFSCDANCYYCEFGRCKLCKQQFELNNLNQCQPICGDGKVVVYTSEQCDVQYQVINSVCSKCKFICSQYCAYCNELVCLRCQDGTYLKNNKCEPICGDKIVFKEVEECEDNNDIPYDGCYKCQYQCIEGCGNCYEGVCDGSCLPGFLPQNNKCKSICGDGRIVGQEECDDQNSIEFDGCYNCKFSCPLNCELCDDGQCKKCDDSYKLVLEKNQCSSIPVCGNGKIDNDQELCDDANNDPDDGCFECRTEVGWHCEHNVCKRLEQLKMDLQFINQTQSKYYVNIQFNYLIYLKDDKNLVDYFTVRLQDYNSYEYEWNCFEISNQSAEISVEIFSTLHSKTVVILSLDDSITSVYEQKLYQLEYQLPIQTTQVVTAVVQKAQSVKDASKYIIISCLSLGSTSLFFGNTDILLEVLSTLQFQAYIKFINVKFPVNLQIYFESSEILSFQPILDFFKISTLLEQVTFKQEIKSSSGKFAVYQEDSDFLTSIFSQFLQGSMLVFLIYNHNFIKSLNFKLINSDKYYNFFSYLYIKLKIKSLIYIHRRISGFSQIVLRLSKQININGLRTLLILNSWDLLFKCFLFLQSAVPLSDFRTTVSTFACLTFIAMYFILLFQNISLDTRYIYKTRQELAFQKFQDCELMKIMIFQFILIYWQNSPILQLVSISLVNLTQLMNIIKFREAFSNLDFSTKMIVEFGITMVMFTSFFYFDDYACYYEFDTLIQIAEMQIYFLLIGLIFVLIKLPIQKSRQFLIAYLKNKSDQQSACRPWV